MYEMTKDETRAFEVLRMAARAYEATAGIPDDPNEDGMTRALRRAMPEIVRLIERQQMYIGFQVQRIKELVRKERAHRARDDG